MLRDPSGWKPKLDAEVIARVSGGRGVARPHHRRPARRPVRTTTGPNASSRRGPESVRAAKVRKLARRLGCVLAERGLRPGHVVSFQLPNWHEAVLIEVACAYAGYVCNPIVPIYRDAEVSFILADAGSRVLFVPKSFREFDYRTMVDRMRTDLPRLGEVVFVRPRNSSTASFDANTVSRSPNSSSQIACWDVLENNLQVALMTYFGKFA